jgi:ABC-type Mn2+/Zn2+ transport system permease subunit
MIALLRTLPVCVYGQRAADFIVAVPCALLSVFLVLKGWALMGDAMSHAVFPGVVLAWMMGSARHWRVCCRSVLRRRDRLPRR